MKFEINEVRSIKSSMKKTGNMKNIESCGEPSWKRGQ
jgi:hypothetical protein